MSGVNATARGNLGSTPLGELLIFCLERSLTGSLVIETPAIGRTGLTLVSGAIVKAKTPEPSCRLGQICVRLGQIDAEEVEAVTLSQGERLLGEALRDLGLLESAQLKVALKEQLVRQVEWVSQLGADSIYGYYEGKDFLARWGGANVEVDPLSLIWSASKVSLRAERAKQVMLHLGSQNLRLHPASRIGRFGFDARARSVTDVLRAKPHTYAELLNTGLLPPVDLDRALATLVLTKHLDLGADEHPLGVDAEATVPPLSRQSEVAQRPLVRRHRRPGEGTAQTEAPVAVDQALLSREKELTSMAERIAGMTLYEVLGVPKEAETTAIQGAFFQLARYWHPDKLPVELRNQRDLATKVFSRMTEAHQVLTNASQRAEYDRLSQEATSSEQEQDRVAAVLRAASAFQKAEILAKRGDWAGAEAAAQRACDDDPEHAEYRAFLAWVVARSGQRAASNLYDDLIKTLDEAVKVNEGSIRLRMYRGEVLKLAGKPNLAIRDFRYVTDLQPNNVEAAREVRLYQMRKQDEPPSQEGLFGRLFKKQ